MLNGHSGGPAFNEHGAVIGWNVLAATDNVMGSSMRELHLFSSRVRERLTQVEQQLDLEAPLTIPMPPPPRPAQPGRFSSGINLLRPIELACTELSHLGVPITELQPSYQPREFPLSAQSALGADAAEMRQRLERTEVNAESAQRTAEIAQHHASNAVDTVAELAHHEAEVAEIEAMAAAWKAQKKKDFATR
eukprot:1136717-Prymnesium_polylepis.1